MLSKSSRKQVLSSDKETKKNGTSEKCQIGQKCKKMDFGVKITKIMGFWGKFLHFVFFAYNISKDNFFDDKILEIRQKQFF